MTGTSEANAGRVVRLEASQAHLAVDVLCESFFDYPVMDYVLEPVDGDYSETLRRLVHFFVMARVHRQEPVLAILDESDALAAAIVTLPGRRSPPKVAKAREDTWRELGQEARRRYEEYGNASLEFELETPNYHLNMIGVRDRARGRGLGRLLIDAVHEMSREDPSSTGVTLTTEIAGNVGLYQHLGYEIVGHVEFGRGLETGGFFRPD